MFLLCLTFELGADGVCGHHDAPPDLDGVGAVGDRVEAGLGDGSVHGEEKSLFLQEF